MVIISIFLALKYQLVASSMKKYLTGNLDSIKNTKVTKAFFITVAVLVTCGFIYYIILVSTLTDGD